MRMYPRPMDGWGEDVATEQMQEGKKEERGAGRGGGGQNAELICTRKAVSGVEKTSKILVGLLLKRQPIKQKIYRTLR